MRNEVFRLKTLQHSWSLSFKHDAISKRVIEKCNKYCIWFCTSKLSADFTRFTKCRINLDVVMKTSMGNFALDVLL